MREGRSSADLSRELRTEWGWAGSSMKRDGDTTKLLGCMGAIMRIACNIVMVMKT